MKKHNLFTVGALAAAMLLGACEKDPNGAAGPEGGKPVVEGIPTYASVTISQSSGMGTYAEKPDSVALGVESGIKSAYVLIFSNGNLEAIEKLEDTSEKQDGSGPYSATFPITTGRKQCFALANLPDTKGSIIDSLKMFFDADSIIDLTSVCSRIVKIDKISTATTDSCFYMGNFYPEGQTEEPVTIQTDPSENKITINIGRMVSKVTPTFSKTATQTGGTLSDLSYRVRNNPKRFYLFPMYSGNTLISPYYNILDYDWTTNKSGYASKLTLGDFFSNGEELGNATDTSNPAEGTIENPKFTAFGSPSYLTENSPRERRARKATMLSIRGTWIPNANQVLSGDGKPTSKALTNKTFARVQVLNKEDEITGYLPGIYDVKDPKLVKVAWKKTIGTEADKINLVDGTATVGDVTYKAVSYTDGKCYYGYWMKKESETATIAEQYALKRNTLYRVNITAVNGPGDPTEEDVLNKPDEVEADTYMEATIKVIDWSVVDMAGGI